MQIMAEFVPFADNIDVGDRMQVLSKFVMPDIYSSSEEKLSPDLIKKAAVVLDLGMGKGALGSVIKGINDKCTLIGVDVRQYPSENCGEDPREKYDQIMYHDLMKDDFWPKIKTILGKDKKADLAIGLPDEVITCLIKNVAKLTDIISDTGLCAFISDIPYKANEVIPFTLYQGKLPTDHTILIYQKPKPK